MLPLPDRKRLFHAGIQSGRKVFLCVQAEMMHEKAPGKIVDAIKNARLIAGFGQHEMSIEVVFAQFVDCCKPHFHQQGNPRFHRVKLKIADCPVLFQKIMEQVHSVFRLAFQKIRNRVTAAGMRLVFIEKMVIALWTLPHILKN
jgi:hypothetical protein